MQLREEKAMRRRERGRLTNRHTPGPRSRRGLYAAWSRCRAAEFFTSPGDGARFANSLPLLHRDISEDDTVHRPRLDRRSIQPALPPSALSQGSFGRHSLQTERDETRSYLVRRPVSPPFALWLTHRCQVPRKGGLSWSHKRLCGESASDRSTACWTKCSLR